MTLPQTIIDAIDRFGDRCASQLQTGAKLVERNRLLAVLEEHMPAAEQKPFAYFQRNEVWNCWEEVLSSAAGQPGVVAAYRAPQPGVQLGAIAAQAVPERQPWAPDACPITGRPLFMWIEHFKTGEMVPTYGGPFDSYTLPERGAEGEFTCERFDHDRGHWIEDSVESLGLVLVDDQSFVVAPDHPRYDEIEAFASAAPTDDRSDWCRSQGCSHKNAGSPVWETPQSACAPADAPKGEPVAWELAEKVRRDLDRQSCPDAYMRIAMESIVKHFTAPPDAAAIRNAALTLLRELPSGPAQCEWFHHDRQDRHSDFDTCQPARRYEEAVEKLRIALKTDQQEQK